MKNKTIIIISLILFAVSIYGENSVAFTLKVKGDVIRTREEIDQQIGSGEQLQNSDELESKQDSYAAIKFVDGSSVVKLFPNSILRINAEKDGDQLNKKSYLKMGELWSKVTKQTGGFDIETPTTVVSVKGTKFLLTVAPSGYSDIFTVEGEVLVKNKKDDNSITVRAGYQAHSTGSGEIEVTQIEEEEMEEITDRAEEEKLKTLEINLENEDGEGRTIKIDMK